MTPLKRQILIVTVILAAIMELIDTSIVNVALSHMSGNLGSTLEDTAWVITSYAIANVIIIPMTSFLTALLGRRNYYIGSIVFFTFFSFLCGQADGIWELVAFRFMQGLAGGALLSVSQTIVFELFPKEKQGVASALFGVGVFIGPTIGPTLGGYITEYMSWPWIFYINLPFGIFAAASCYFLLQEPPIKTIVKKIDWIGIFLLVIWVSTLQTVLERGETEDWFETNYIIYFTVVAAISLTAFIIWEFKEQNPVVNLKVLKSRTLSIAAILTFITGIGMFTSIFLTPVVAQRLLGFTPSQTGLMLLPGSVLAIFGLVLSGKMLQKGVSPVVIIITGFLLFILFNWRMSQMSPFSSFAEITINLIFRALGMAFLTVPLTVLAVSSLKPESIPQGASLNNMMRQLGGSFGISIINTYSYQRIAVHRNSLISHVTAYNPLTNERLEKYTSYFQAKGMGIMEAKQRALKLLDLNVVKQSTFMSYLDSYMLVGILFIVALPLLIFVLKAKKPAGDMVLSDH